MVLVLGTFNYTNTPFTSRSIQLLNYHYSIQCRLLLQNWWLGYEYNL
jgi:hypothetical protein